MYIVVKGKTKDDFYIYDIYEGTEFEDAEPVPVPRAKRLAGDSFTYGEWYDIVEDREVRGFLKDEDLQKRKKSQELEDKLK